MGSSTVSSKILNRVIWRELIRIQSALDWSPQTMAAHLELPMSEYLEKQALQDELPTSALFCFALKIGVSPEDIYLGQVDLPALQSRILGMSATLPLKFQQNAFSKMRTARNLLVVAERSFGPEFRARLLRRHQLTESLVAQGALPVSFHLPLSICRGIGRRAGGVNHFLPIAMSAWAADTGEGLSTLLSEARTPQECTEIFFDRGVASQVEKNLAWRIVKRTPAMTLIEGATREELEDPVLLENLMDPYAITMRMAFLKVYTQFAGHGINRAVISEFVRKKGNHHQIQFSISHATQLSVRG